MYIPANIRTVTVRRAVVCVLLSVMCLRAGASVYNSINFDYKMVAAMTEALGAEYAAELLTRDDLEEIEDYYEAAGVAAAGIYLSKYLDRQALVNVDGWADAEANYYYKRIYRMAVRIMAKVLDVSEMMMEDPLTAVYWVNYIYKVCEDTRSLCYVFENVVSNSALTFDDIAFLTVRDDVMELYDIGSLLGDVEADMDAFADMSAYASRMSVDALQSDVETFVSMGVGLATAGLSDGSGVFALSSAWNDLFSGKATAALTLGESYYSLFSSLSGESLASALAGITGSDYSQLFDLSGYDASSWLSDYDAGDDADDGYVAGSESATFAVTCTDSVCIASGSVTYKCSGSCKNKLTEHCKTDECSMKTTLDGETADASELEALMEQYSSQIELIEEEIAELEERRSELTALLSSTFDSMDRISYQSELADVESEIDGLEDELAELQSSYDAAADARAELLADGDDDDGVYRIPAIMQDLTSYYTVEWDGDGTWSDYTYTRKGTLGSGTEVTFTATLTLTKKAKYFLGVRIHRAKITIDWELTHVSETRTVVDYMELDPDAGDDYNSSLVSARIDEIKESYPSCTVSVTYDTVAGAEDDTDDAYHLLWSSDRLDVAREVDGRMRRIFADLVSMERFMRYKVDFVDLLFDVMPYSTDIDEYAGRKRTVADSCRAAWIGRAVEM